MQLIKTKKEVPKPQAVIYEVNLSIDVDVIEEFDEWLHNHTEEMLAIPGFISAATSVPDSDDENKKYRVVQYRLSDESALRHYLEHDAERMRAKALKRFDGNFVASRRILTIAEASLAEQGMCANCGNELSGRYCQVCGQREEPRVPTLMSLAREATNALFGLESKLWKTIAILLFKPGQLTLAYLSGKRQKYTSPLRLYLLFSIAAFAYFSYVGSQDFFDKNTNDEQAAVENIESDNPDTNANKEIVEVAEGIDKALGDSDESIKVKLPFFSKEFNENIEQQIKSVGNKIKKDVKAGNAEEVINHFVQPLPKALLLFLPFIALAFKILYFGSGKYYIEHLIYLLHNHAFIFAILIGTVMLSRMVEMYPGSEVFLALAILSGFFFYIGNYFYPSLRRKYTKSRFKAILYALIIFGIMFGLLQLTLAEGIGAVLGILWGFYIPYYIYRSMRVVYQYSRWITLPSYFVISLVYLMMFSVMLVLSVAFAGSTYS